MSKVSALKHPLYFLFFQRFFQNTIFSTKKSNNWTFLFFLVALLAGSPTQKNGLKCIQVIVAPNFTQRPNIDKNDQRKYNKNAFF